MSEINPFLIPIIAFSLPTLMLLVATLYHFITIINFNKHGVNKRGRILAHHIQTSISSTDNPNDFNNLDGMTIQFEIDNKKVVKDVTYSYLSHSLKKFPIGKEQKIKILKINKNNKVDYKVRVLNDDKEKISYQVPIIFSILTVIAFSIIIWWVIGYLTQN